MKKTILYLIMLILIAVAVNAASPSIEVPRIDPLLPITTDDLLGYCNASDSDGDFLTYNYKWYNNTNLFLEATKSINDFTLQTNYTVFNASYDADEHKGDYSVVTRIDDTHALTAYVKNTCAPLCAVDGIYLNSTYIDSNGDISAIDSLEVSTDSTAAYIDLIMIDSDHAIIAYQGQDSDGYLKTINIDGSYGLSINYTLEFDTGYMSNPSMVKIDDTHFIISYHGASAYIKTYLVEANYTVSEISSTTFDTAINGLNKLISLDSGHFLGMYRDVSSYGQLITFNINGSYEIGIDDTVQFTTDIGRFSSMGKINNSAAILAYHDISLNPKLSVVTINTSYEIELKDTYSPSGTATHQAVIGIDDNTALYVNSNENSDGVAKLIYIGDDYSITNSSSIKYSDIYTPWNSIARLRDRQYLVAYKSAEESIYLSLFNVSGYEESTEYLISTISSTYTDVGEDWSFYCLANDGTTNSSWSSIEVTIQNRLPIITTGNYTTNISYFHDSPDIDFDFTDADGHSVNWSTNATIFTINQSGYLSGNTDYNDIGSYNISINVTDGFNETSVWLYINVQNDSFFSGSGGGTEDYPFQITTVEQFRETDIDNIPTSQQNNNYYWKLMNDLNLSEGIYGIGEGFPQMSKFGGHFDGNNYTIHDYYCNVPTGYCSFYESIHYPQNMDFYIKNLNIDGVDIYASYGSPLIETSSSAAGYYFIIENVHVKNALITGGYYGGGITTFAYGDTDFINCSFEGTISMIDVVGGITSEAYQTRIFDSYARANLEQTYSGSYEGDSIGGLVGWSEEVNITNSFFIGTIEGHNSVGGLVGGLKYEDVYINNSYAIVDFLTPESERNYPQDPIAHVHTYGTQHYVYGDNVYYPDYNGENGSFIIGATNVTLLSMRNQSTFSGFDFTNKWTTNGDTFYPTLQENSNTDWTYSGLGNGTENNAYDFYSCRQLQEYWLFDDYASNGTYYELQKDIDCGVVNIYDNDTTGFIPIGGNETETPEGDFCGYFDGNGYTIDGIWMNHTGATSVGGMFVSIGDCDGLSGHVATTVINFTIDSSTFYTQYGNVGALSPLAETSVVTISDITLTNNIIDVPYSEYGNVGGVIGNISQATLSTISTTNTSILSVYKTGIVAGNCENSILNNITSNGTIDVLDTSSTITPSYIAGVCALSENTTYNTIEADLTVSGVDNYVGGVVAYSYGGDTLQKVSTEPTISAGSYIGGLIGWYDGSTTQILNSSSIVDITTNESYVGGLVGATSTGILTIKDAYSKGDITGVTYLGGIVGGITNAAGEANIEDAYTKVDITGSGSISTIGTFMGTPQASDVTTSYVLLSGIYDIFGTNGTGNTTTLEEKNSFQMTYEDTFDGWDFVSTWSLPERESPIFKWQTLVESLIMLSFDVEGNLTGDTVCIDFYHITDDINIACGTDTITTTVDITDTHFRTKEDNESRSTMEFNVTADSNSTFYIPAHQYDLAYNITLEIVGDGNLRDVDVYVGDTLVSSDNIIDGVRTITEMAPGTPGVQYTWNNGAGYQTQYFMLEQDAIVTSAQFTVLGTSVTYNISEQTIIDGVATDPDYDAHGQRVTTSGITTLNEFGMKFARASSAGNVYMQIGTVSDWDYYASCTKSLVPAYTTTSVMEWYTCPVTQLLSSGESVYLSAYESGNSLNTAYSGTDLKLNGNFAEFVTSGTEVIEYEEFDATHYLQAIAEPRNVRMYVGDNDNYVLNAVSVTTPQTATSSTIKTYMNNYLTDCTPNSDGYCAIPIKAYSTGDRGLLNITSISVGATIDTEDITIPASYINDYLSTQTGATVIPITIYTESAGNLTINSFNYNYLGGNKTFEVMSHNLNYSNTKSLYIDAVYSGWDVSLPSSISYIDWYPASMTSENVTPFGQSDSTPIINISSEAYGGDSFNFSMVLGNEECVELYMSNTNNRTDATKMNTSWQVILDNMTYEKDSGIWLWATLNCSYTDWQVWNPDWYFKACDEAADYCVEDIV